MHEGRGVSDEPEATPATAHLAATTPEPAPGTRALGPLVPLAAIVLVLVGALALREVATIVVPVVYVLARWVGSTAVAALTVVTFVAMPLTFINLSRGYPDLMAIALNGLTLILVLHARDSDRVWPLLVAGLIAGWAFEVRETTVFTWPVFAVLIWGLSRRWVGYAAVVVGLVPWAVLDLGLSWLYLNDPLAKWHVLTGSDLNDSTSPLDGSYLGQQRWWYLTRLPIAMAQEPWGWVLLVVSGLGIAGGLILRGRVGLYVVWALFPVVLLVGTKLTKMQSLGCCRYGSVLLLAVRVCCEPPRADLATYSALEAVTTWFRNISFESFCRI